MAKRPAFTLVEVIVYICLLALVLTSLVIFIIAIANNRDKAYSASEVEANVRLVTGKLNTLIHSARSLDEAGSIFADDQGRLALFLGDNQTEPVVIEAAAGRVRLQVGSGQPQFISSQAVSFSRLRFTKLSDRQLGVELTVAYGPLGASLTPEKSFTQIVKTTINLR